MFHKKSIVQNVNINQTYVKYVLEINSLIECRDANFKMS